MGIAEGQKIEMKWNNRLAKHYLELGYPKLKPNESFYVKPEHLTDSSNKEVICECEICKDQFPLAYVYARKNTIHFCSNKCKSNYDKHDKQFLIDEFNRFFKDNGRYPTKEDMKVKHGYPSHYYYDKVFGSWDEFIREMDIYYDTHWLKHDINILYEMYENEPKDKILNSLINEFSWEHIRSKANGLGLYRKYRETSSNTLDKDFLISEYWRYVKEFERYPYAKELNNADGYPSISGYKRIWGTWDNFLKDIGVVRRDCDDGWIIHDENILYKYYENKDIIPEYIMIKLNFWRTWGSIKSKASKLGLSRKSGTKKKFTSEKLTKEIKRYYKEYKHIPTYEEFDANEDFPSSKTIQKRFGSWNKAIESAGFDVNLTRYHNKDDIIIKAQDFYTKNKRSPFYNELGFSTTLAYNYWNEWDDMLKEANLPPTPKSYGVLTKDKSGNTHKSKIEAAISNVLIDNGYEFTTENRYKDFVNCDKNYLFDWVIKDNNKNIFVEYFGLNASWDRKEIDEYKKGMNDKIQLCVDNGLSLVALDQNDLLDDFEGLVKKFDYFGVCLEIKQEHIDTIGYKVSKLNI